MKKHLTIVIKLGTSSIVDEKTHEPLLSILSLIVETAVKLQHDGHKVVLVSSGAIGVALRQMNLEKRPKHLPQVQALAAIGQCRLIALWDQLFAHMRQPVAQILLTRNDIADRTQYLNAQNTFFQLLDMGVIPIVNENDTLAVTEIKFGDNDTLSAITAGMVHADYLFLMTDVDCLFDKNPRTNPDAKPIEVVDDIEALAVDVSSKGSSLGTGGMFTKIVAARRATSVGVTTVITKSSRPGNIRSIIQYAEAQKALQKSEPTTPPANSFQLPSAISDLTLSAISTPDKTPSLSAGTSARNSPSLHPILHTAPLHTRFLPASKPTKDRHFWLLHCMPPTGNVYIDEKAYKALQEKANLFPSGIVDVDGLFAQQEAVRIFLVKRLTQSEDNSESSPAANGHSVLSTDQDSREYTPTSSVPSTPRPTFPTFEKMNPAPVEVGRAIINYSSQEVKRIKGLRSTEISSVLGYADTENVAHRENIALFPSGRSRPGTPGTDVAETTV